MWFRKKNEVVFDSFLFIFWHYNMKSLNSKKVISK